MKNINIKNLFKSKAIGKIIILIASSVLIYLTISVYFANHYFFNTVINGVNVSLKAHDDANHIIRSYIKDYDLQLIERKVGIEKLHMIISEITINKDREIELIELNINDNLIMYLNNGGEPSPDGGGSPSSIL